MEFIDGKTIRLEKAPNELDKFVLRFIKILERYTEYVIVSGYVSILLGRSRTTEDIDIFIKRIDKEKFKGLYEELKKEGYWCLNAESEGEIYDYLEEGLAVRFARRGEITPNFEIKPAKKLLDKEVFTDFLVVEIKGEELKISSLERQIAFKKYYLKSDKDLEDAAHLEEVFKEKINWRKVEEYRRLIESETA